jgi:hypothetical protein
VLKFTIRIGDPARGALATGGIVTSPHTNFCAAFADAACTGSVFTNFGSVNRDFGAGVAGQVACYKC